MDAPYVAQPRRKRHFLRNAFILIVVVLALYAVYAFTPLLKASALTVLVPQGLTRSDIANRIGTELAWSDADKKEFSATYAQMQWMEFNSVLSSIFKNKFKWSTDEQELFLTSSSRYSEPQYDFLSTVYAPGTYSFAKGDSFASIADELIKPVAATTSVSEYIEAHLDEKAAQNAAALVRSSLENLPDLSPLPPQDLKIESGQNGDVLLRFSTTYYNQGSGPLELYADPATKGIRSDLDRTVFQRIYRKDGTTRSREAGVFLWHQQHLHYHFSDFAYYDLDAVDVQGPVPDLSGIRQKSTFCIRDISLTDLALPNKAKDASYKICGKELQGISVGWGDTYFFNYADQFLNVTDLPSGTYKLTFIINPLNRFDEADMSNNKSSAVFKLDMQKRTVEVVSEEPKENPKVEHVYPEQDCPVCTL